MRCGPVSINLSLDTSGKRGKPTPITISGTVQNCSGNCTVTVTYTNTTTGQTGTVSPSPTVNQSSGAYSMEWTPPSEGNYQITATTNSSASAEAEIDDEA